MIAKSNAALCGLMIGLLLMAVGTPKSKADSVVAWGNNGFSQVSSTPAGTNFTAIAAGVANAVALRADGSVAAWGYDGNGQVSDAPTANGFTALAAGGYLDDYALGTALGSNGSIVVWGDDSYGEVSNAPSGAGFIAVAAGQGTGYALAADGSVVAWGNDSSNQVSGVQPVEASGPFTAIAAGVETGYALTSRGTIVAWGGNSTGELNVPQPPAGQTFTAIAAGAYTGYALTSHGSIVAWGDDSSGEVSQAPSGTGFTAIAAGGSAAIALTSTGSLVAWGDDSEGVVSKVPKNGTYAALAAGPYNGYALQLSNTATLSGLVLSNGTLTPAFSPTTANYTATVAYPGAASLSVTPTTNNANATVLVNGNAATSGSPSSVNLTGGSNTVTVIVTAQDGVTTKTYKVTVTNQIQATVNTLAATSVATTSAVFNGAVTANGTNTTASFIYGTDPNSLTSTIAAKPATVTGLTTTPVNAKPNLTPGTTYYFQAQGVSSANGGIPVLGGVQSLTTISNDATLLNTAGLALANGGTAVTLTPSFSSTTTSYTATVAGAASLSVTPTANNANATVLVNGNTATSGSASSVNLIGGSNTVTVKVTAQDGVTTKTYTVTVTNQIQPAVNTLAATNVAVTSAVFNGAVTANGTNTTAGFIYGTSPLSLTSTIAAKPATVTGFTTTPVNAKPNLTPGTTYYFQAQGVSSASGGVPVLGGVQSVTTISNDATLLNTTGLALANGGTALTLTPGFSSATTNYTATVAYPGVASINVTPTSNNANATVLVNGNTVASGSATSVNLAGGPNTLTVQVTAQDGVTSKTYKVTVTNQVLPSATTLAATNVTTNGVTSSATFTGTSNADGTTTTVTFNYGLTTAYGSSVAATPKTIKGSAFNDESAVLTTLLPGQTYHYQIQASSAIGTVTGADVTFTTPASNVATLSNLTLSPGPLSPAFNTATLGYTATENNGTTSVTVKPVVTQTIITAGANPGATVTVNGMAAVSGVPSTVNLNLGANSIPVVVTAQDGSTRQTYNLTVTRTGLVATVTTGAATAFTSDSEIVNGTVNPHYDSTTTASIDYGTTTSYGNSAAASPSPLSGNNNVQGVSATLSGLSPSTVYHYRVHAVNATGPALGADKTFTTLSAIASWRQHYFGTTANSGVTADTASYTGDGVTNLVKYALGLDPTTANDAAAVLPSIVPGQDRLTLAFTLPDPAPSDITYKVVVSADASTWTTLATKVGTSAWTWNATGASQVSVTPGSTSDAVQVGDSVTTSGNPIRIMRLQVSDSTDATTGLTPPLALATVSLPAGTSNVVPILLNPAVFSGPATFAATTVTPTTSPQWTPGAYAETSNVPPTPNYPTYYVEVISGPYAGYLFDIINNTSTGLTISEDATTDALALAGQPVNVVVRQHVTLDQLASEATGLQAAGTPDSVKLFNSDGGTSTRYFTTTTSGTSWVAEDMTSPAGQTVVYPGSGFLMTTAGAATQTLAGNVKTTVTVIPLYTGSAGWFNLVGPLIPTASTKLSSLNLASLLKTDSGSFTLLSVDGQSTLLGTYISITGTSLKATPTNAPTTLSGSRGIEITVGSDALWISNPVLTQ